MPKSVILKILLTMVTGLSGFLMASIPQSNAQTAPSLNPFLMVDSRAMLGFPPTDNISPSYAYGPSIIYQNGTYYSFFCSTPLPTARNPLYPPPYDFIRFASSINGINWSTPQLALQPSYIPNPMVDASACDPSIVFANGYYYLYYGSMYDANAPGFSSYAAGSRWLNGSNRYPIVELTNMHVARASEVGGPYYEYTRRGTWEQFPPDPQPVINPIVNQNISSNPCDYFNNLNNITNQDICKTFVADQNSIGVNYYGAGQPSVIFQNNLFHMWYTDDSYEPGCVRTSPTDWTPPCSSLLYHLTSPDGVSWVVNQNKVLKDTTGKVIYNAGSIDVKWDDARKRYVMLDFQNQHLATSFMQIRYSIDGDTWQDPIVLYNSSQLPNYANNPGMSGDERGYLLSKTIISFGDSYILDYSDTASYNDENFGRFNLWGFFVNLPGEWFLPVITVTNTADTIVNPATGTLRRAVSDAAAAGGGTVTFAASLGNNPQITLVEPLIVPDAVTIAASCDNKVRIVANFANALQLQGHNLIRGLQISTSVSPGIKSNTSGNQLICTSAQVGTGAPGNPKAKP